METEYKRNWILLVDPSKKEIRDAQAKTLYEIMIFELRGKLPCKIKSIDFVEINETSGYVKVTISE